MAVTLEMLHQEMKQVKKELHHLRNIMAEEYSISSEALHALNKTRNEMDKGNIINHECAKRS